MQPGQFLVRGDEKRLIVEVLTNIIAIQTDIADIITWIEKDRLANYGWSLLEEPWVPKDNDMVHFVNMWGSRGVLRWGSIDEEERKFVLEIGNYGRTPEDSELYKQKLIERMGRKGN